MKIPDRWLPYQPMGEQIRGTRFVTFKVPLKKAICDNLVEDLRFTPEMLMDQRPDIKLVVDLTNTTKYYNSKVFTDKGVAYKKIQTPGQVIPPRYSVNEFFEVVDEFLKANPDKGSLIGVHCTHGLNRTSYFVCCYMIHRMKVEPKAAVAEFERARGHVIERPHYVADLLNRGLGSDNTRGRGGGGGGGCPPPSPLARVHPVDGRDWRAPLTDQRRPFCAGIDSTNGWFDERRSGPYRFNQRHRQLSSDWRREQHPPADGGYRRYSRAEGVAHRNPPPEWRDDQQLPPSVANQRYPAAEGSRHLHGNPYVARRSREYSSRERPGQHRNPTAGNWRAPGDRASPREPAELPSCSARTPNKLPPRAS